MVDDPIIIYPKWQPQLIAALVETDPDELLERVKEAEKAISKRFEKISRSTSHAAEIEAIENAMDTLDVLNWCNGDVGVEKPPLLKKRSPPRDRKCPPKVRTSFIGHPKATKCLPSSRV